MSTRSVQARASAMGAVALALAACSGPTRVATLNQTTRTSGSRVAAVVQLQLAEHGFPTAAVRCAKTIIVNVGPAVSCKLSGAGANGTVKFTFMTLDGKIDLSSVRVS